jgi:hypothetical protein
VDRGLEPASVEPDFLCVIDEIAAAPSHSLTASTNSGAGAALVANVRIVMTAFGATAVWIVWFSRRGSGAVGHLGGAHDGA